MPLFRALAKNMASMTNVDESPYAFLTEHFSLYSIYSLAPWSSFKPGSHMSPTSATTIVSDCS